MMLEGDLGSVLSYVEILGSVARLFCLYYELWRGYHDYKLFRRRWGISVFTCLPSNPSIPPLWATCDVPY